MRTFKKISRVSKGRINGQGRQGRQGRINGQGRQGR